tara:strand:+ start:158 stop:277 length:120 start_codon:yes stop_codon:yes gene_type:complete
MDDEELMGEVDVEREFLQWLYDFSEEYELEYDDESGAEV